MQQYYLVLIFALLNTGVVSADPDQWMRELSHDEHAKRKSAHDSLLKWAEDINLDGHNKLKQALKETDSPEVRMRLNDIIDQTDFAAKPNTRGFIGIEMLAALDGVKVRGVTPNSPASKIGLLVNDVIIEVDDLNLKDHAVRGNSTMQLLSAYVKSKNAGQKLKLKVKRNGKIIEKTLKLADYDSHIGKLNRQEWRGLQGQGGVPKLRLVPGQQLKLEGLELDDEMQKKLQDQFKQQILDAEARQNKALQMKKEHLEQLEKRLQKQLQQRQK